MKIIDINGMQREVESVVPDPKYPGYVKIQFRRHVEWFTIPEFLEFNPTLKDLVKGTLPTADDVVGVATRAAASTLTDSTQNWKENAYTEFFCWISRGKGEGQKRLVTKNTKHTLVLDKPWDVKPNQTSQYVLSHNIQDVKAMGNSLPEVDMKELERQALKLDKKRGLLTSDVIKKNYKYLKPEEM